MQHTLIGHGARCQNAKASSIAYLSPELRLCCNFNPLERAWSRRSSSTLLRPDRHGSPQCTATRAIVAGLSGTKLDLQAWVWMRSRASAVCTGVTSPTSCRHQGTSIYHSPVQQVSRSDVLLRFRFGSGPHRSRLHPMAARATNGVPHTKREPAQGMASRIRSAASDSIR